MGRSPRLRVGLSLWVVLPAGFTDPDLGVSANILDRASRYGSTQSIAKVGVATGTVVRGRVARCRRLWLSGRAVCPLGHTTLRIDVS
jgi:hypothetical protein